MSSGMKYSNKNDQIDFIGRPWYAGYVKYLRKSSNFCVVAICGNIFFKLKI